MQSHSATTLRGKRVLHVNTKVADTYPTVPATQRSTHEIRLHHDGRHRRDRLLQPRRNARLRLCLGHRQPDAVLRLLRRPRPRGTTDKAPAHRTRHRHLRHAHPAGTGRCDGHPEPPGTRPRIPRYRHRQHRDAQHGPAPHEDRRLRRVLARPLGTPAWRDRRLRLQRHHPADQHADARLEVHEPGAEDPALRLRLWPTRHGTGRRIR